MQYNLKKKAKTILHSKSEIKILLNNNIFHFKTLLKVLIILKESKYINKYIVINICQFLYINYNFLGPHNILNNN